MMTTVFTGIDPFATFNLHNAPTEYRECELYVEATQPTEIFQSGCTVGRRHKLKQIGYFDCLPRPVCNGKRSIGLGSNN